MPATMHEATALAGTIVARLNEGGIGRSSLIAACVLVLLGFAPAMAFDLIDKARGVKGPDTEGQRDWVEKFRGTTTTGGIIPPEARP